jgi:hypothetical protein
MATVRAFQSPGLKLWFYSNDHEPPHFHAKRSGEWEVKVRFLLPTGQMIEVKWSTKGGPTAKTLKKLCRLAEQHRPALLEQWEEIHGDNAGG